MKAIAWLLPVVMLLAVASWGCDSSGASPPEANGSGSVSASSCSSCCGGSVAPKKVTCEGCGNEKGSPECCSEKPKS
jgi:hypothetical protein